MGGLCGQRGCPEQNFLGSAPPRPGHTGESSGRISLAGGCRVAVHEDAWSSGDTPWRMSKVTVALFKEAFQDWVQETRLVKGR